MPPAAKLGSKPIDDELGYPHERVQAEFTRLAAAGYPRSGSPGGAPHLLVIGGGGYTLPRWAAKTFPAASVEVVEIDPGVTEVAHHSLGLARDTPVITYNMDGRQFVQERGEPGHYQLIVQDAVNDLSVPYHIMTKEYNDAVERLLAPDGIYLLTVIDEFEDGLLMRAAVRTLREKFGHVELLASSPLWKDNQRRGVRSLRRRSAVRPGGDSRLPRPSRKPQRRKRLPCRRWNCKRTWIAGRRRC